MDGVAAVGRAKHSTSVPERPQREIALIGRFMAVALLASAAPVLAADADIIWFGGPIITVADKTPRAEAVAVKDGRIVAVGTKAAVMKAEQGKATRLVDLAGHTLVPGFVDGHGHLSGVAIQAVSANLLPPPDGPATSIADIQRIMRDFIATSPAAKAGLAIGFDYDDSQLAERRAPTRQELDAVSTTIPIMIIHQSGHLGAFNSLALERAGITAASPDPSGGVIQREADGKTPAGVLEESALGLAAYKLFPKSTPEQGVAMIGAAQRIYMANGYTTVQDGKTDGQSMAMLIGAAKAGVLKIDVVSYADLITLHDKPVLQGPLVSATYTDHFRIGGVKLTFDGSPQGKTAWFTKPYFQVPAGQKADYAGYPAFPKPGEAQGWVDMAYRKKWQLLIHANGDAAIDALIRTVGSAQAQFGGADRRTVMIHGQYLRADQIAPLKTLGVFPALFPMHTFYWGDWHRESVAGPERAEFISPTRAARDAGMKLSIHHDAPVTFPNSMRVFDSAVNRTTRSGRVLGPGQRLTPMEALQAMTIWPAYQHFEEATKGSIEPGKLADLVILDKNPLTVRRAKIKDIKVLETIKAGVTVYSAGQ
jgi:predicted amidohydrolase YtcJ